MHVETPLNTLIKSNNNEKLVKYCVKIKLRRYPTSHKLDLSEFKMALFDNGDLEEFLLVIRNLNMNLEAPGTLADGSNIKYLRTLVREEALQQFDKLSIEVGSTTPENLTSIILGLGKESAWFKSKAPHCSSDWS